MTISELAGEAREHFEIATRPDGDAFWRRHEGTPEWVTEMIHEAHGDKLPDDWVYEAIVNMLDSIADSGAGDYDDLDDQQHEIIDGLVDISTHDLTAWLHNDVRNLEYVDEVLQSGIFEPSQGAANLLMLAQYEAYQHIYNIVSHHLRERLND